MAGQDIELVGDRVRPGSEEVASVGVLGDEAEGLALAAAADEYLGRGPLNRAR